MYDLDLLAAEAKAKAQQKTKERNARYYKSNRESLTIKKAEYDSQHKAEKRKSQASYYSKHRPEKKAAVTANRNLIKKNLDIAGRLKDFRTSQRDGFSYPCASCCRLWFKSSVVNITNPLPLLFEISFLFM